MFMRLTGMLILIGFYFIIYTPMSFAETINVDQLAKIYQIGDEKYFSVIVPAPGFIGAPPSTIPMPDISIPTRDEDYITRYIVIRIIDKRIILNGIRIVFNIDKVDDEGKLLKSNIYYQYLDITDNDIKLITKNKDDNEQNMVDYIIEGIPLPFNLTLPIDYLENSNINGHLYGNYGSIYTIYNDNNEISNINVLYFKQITKNELYLQALESQKWSKTNDWMWDEMKRIDRSGNIMIKCIRLLAPDRE